MTAAQQETHGLVRAALQEAFGAQVREAPSEPAFHVPLGRIGARVEVVAIGDSDAAIDVYAWIAQGLEATPEMAAFLAVRNAGLRFGALCVDGDGDVIFRHALFPDGASTAVLSRLVMVIATTAEDLDDELRSRFG